MRQSIILMFITIIAKIFGLLREISLSYVYGTGPTADAFLVSFFIPSILINGINLGIATGFIPIYSEIYNSKGRIQADIFTNNVVNLTLILSTLSTIPAIFFVDEIISLAAIGLEGEVLEQAVFFARMVMTSIVVASVAGVYRGYLQAYKHFAVTVITTIIMNLAIIISIFISGKSGYKLLGFGTGLGMNLQYLIFIPGILSTGYRYVPTLDIKDKNLTKMTGLAFPILLGVLVNEVNIIVDKSIASTLQIGAISALNYSSGIQEFVVGVVILSIITVRYTDMSELSARGEYEKLTENYNYTLKSILFLVIPATLGLMAFSREIIVLLFFRGAFDITSLEITSEALFYYSFGIVGIALSSVVQRIYYSIKSIKEAILISIGSVTLNIILNLWLSKIFGIPGLAMATSLAMTLSGLVSVILLKKRGISLSGEILVPKISKTFINSLIVISLAKIFHMNFPNNLTLLASIFIAVVGYIHLGLRTGIIEKDDIEKIFKRKSKL